MENIQMEGVDPCTDEAFSAEFEAMLDTHFVHAERAPDGSPAGLWLLGPEDKRADGDRPLRSYFRSVVTLLPCFTFRNVLWSTHDPKHGASSWIGLWRAKTGILNPSCTCCNATFDLVGAHIIWYGWFNPPPPGVCNIVFIVPLCKWHNARPVYETMNPQRPTEAIALDWYFL